MSEMNWSEFDKKVDLEGMRNDIKEIEKNGGKQNYKEVPHGNYEVAVEKMEMKLSSTKKAMISIWFKIVDGEYKNSLLFMNQVIESAFGIHKAYEMLRSLVSESSTDFEIDVNDFSYAKCNDLVLDVFEEIHGNYEYALEYKANSKNPQFNDFRILEVYVLED